MNTQSKCIKDVFDKISKSENHEFEIDKQYVNKTQFEIETMNGFVPVVAMMLKHDVGIKLTSNGVDILVSKLHRISTPTGVKYVKDLCVGDELSHKNGIKKIDAILETGEVIVYDLTIDSEDHLFLDSNGFIHHNTYHVTEGPRSLKTLLGAEGKRWVYHSGTKASSKSLYKSLFMDRSKIIVFDEADSLLKNKDILMMLKPILDTSGDNMASYMTDTKNMGGMTLPEIEAYSNEVQQRIMDGEFVGRGKNDVMLPSKFQFTGGMVFISNMKSSEIEQAIMSRSIFIDVHLAEQDVMKRIKSIGYATTESHATRTKDDVDLVLNALGEGAAKETEITYMTPEYARKNKQVTVRAMQLAFVLKESGLARWAELAALYA